MADLFDAGKEVIEGLPGIARPDPSTVLRAGSRGRLPPQKADVAFAKLAAGDDFGLEFVMISEIEMLADTDLAAGADQAFPFLGIRT